MSLIHVPVTAAVRKYILKEHHNFVTQENDRPVITLNKKYFLGNFIISLMTDNLEHFRIYRRPQVYITFRLSKRFEKYYMDEDNLAKLGYHLDHLFKDEFCKFISFYHSFGLTITEAMNAFYDRYDLTEEDYGRDTMRRYYNRYGADGSEIKKQKNIPKKMSRSCPKDLEYFGVNGEENITFLRMRHEIKLFEVLEGKNCEFLRLRKEMLKNSSKSRPAH